MTRPLIRLALPKDKDDIIRLGKMNSHTRTVSAPGYLSEQAFTLGWLAVAELFEQTVGFYCLRHCKRAKHTSLYFIGVDPAFQKVGIGTALVSHAFAHSPHGEIRLVCDDDNEEAFNWYLNHAFGICGFGENAAGNTFVRMACSKQDWDRSLLEISAASG